MLTVLTINQSEQWDEIVSSFKNYDVYWLSGYVKAFEIHGDGEPMLFYYSDENCRGINVVMKRDIAMCEAFKGILKENTLFDFATPYGYGGWLIEGNKYDSLFEEYEKWCNDYSIVSEFVRFHPVINNHIQCYDAYRVVPLGETVAMKLDSPKIIWDNITSKNRNLIRRAEKSNITIHSGFNEDILTVFKKIYESTMDKDNADAYYYFKDEFYLSILKDLGNHANVFYATLEDGTIVSASIMIYANGKLNYHLSGSLKAYQHLAPSNLMLWKAAEWGSTLGMKTFHLGGGRGSQDDSLLHFKRQFYRGDLCRFYIGQKIFNMEMYNELIKKRGTVESTFFPLYRVKI